MKNSGNNISKMAVYGLTLVITAFVATAQADQKGDTAKVMAVKGKAQYSAAGGAWLPLELGKILSSGSVVKTFSDSQVDLFLKFNGPVIRVTADTTLGLTKLLYNESTRKVVIDTKLDLSSGRILGNVRKLSATSRYEVIIPSGTVSVRGSRIGSTQYDIMASGLVTVSQYSTVQKIPPGTHLGALLGK